MTRPTTQLVDGLAYQVVGDGPIDLLFVNAWFTDLELQWEEPGLAAFLERLASFSRVVLVDKRGMGRSARVPPDALPSVDERAADLARAASRRRQDHDRCDGPRLRPLAALT